jgi:hypothetical protein
MPLHRSKGITKCRGLFVIPCCLGKRDLIGVQRVSKQGHETVKAEQDWGCALNRQIRPLPLGLNPQLGMALLKRCFQAPAVHKIFDDFLSRLALIDGKKRFWRTFSFGVACQNPADW